MTGTRRRADAALTSRLLCTLDALPRGWVRHAVGIGVPVALACYAAIFRTHGISDHLWFLGDQQRDWLAVQGAFADLPRVGTPVSTGGVSLGPVFYWVLWTIRQVLSPVFGNLPHVGAVGLVMLRSLSDGLLAAALLRRGVPVAAVGGILLVLVSSPFEGALAATIWNPGLSVTFVNLTVVLLLRWSARPWTLWRVGTLAATAWLAVQAHTPAVFVAAPVLLSLLWVASRDARLPWPRHCARGSPSPLWCWCCNSHSCCLTSCRRRGMVSAAAWLAVWGVSSRTRRRSWWARAAVSWLTGRRGCS